MILLVITESDELRRTLTAIGDSIQATYVYTIDHALRELGHKQADLIIVDVPFLTIPDFKKLKVLYHDSLCYYVENIHDCNLNLDDIPSSRVLHAKSPDLLYQTMSRLYQFNNTTEMNTQEQLDELGALLSDSVGHVDHLGKRVEALEEIIVQGDVPGTLNAMSNSISDIDNRVRELETDNHKIPTPKETGTDVWQFWKPEWWRNFSLPKAVVGAAAVIIALNTVLPFTVNLVLVLKDLMINLYALFSTTGG